MCEPYTTLFFEGILVVLNINGKAVEGIPCPPSGTFNRVYHTYDTLHKCAFFQTSKRLNANGRVWR